MSDASLFPMFVKLTGRRCVVVGGGTVAESKINSLLLTGAEIIVVSPQATHRVRALAAEGRLRWLERTFAPTDLAGAFLTVAATNAPETNQAIFAECRRRGVLCNAVDDPDNCDFYYGAVVRRGALQIAISTGGGSPGLAGRLRRELETQFGPEYEAWLLHVSEGRRQIQAAGLPPAQKQTELERLVSRSSFEEFQASHRPSGPTE